MIAGIKVLYLLLGIAVMFISALMFQIKTDDEFEKNTKSGIALAIFSGICFGFTALLNSIVSTPAIVGDKFTFAQLLYHSVSLIVFSAIIYIIIPNKAYKSLAAKQRFKNIFKVNRKSYLPFIAGAMFLIATLLTIYSYRMIPNAVAWSITQLNVFWTVFIGIFILKEVNFKQHSFRISAGVLMAIAACVLLFFAV
jgi:glucose uptake protein GlcU